MSTAPFVLALAEQRLAEYPLGRNPYLRGLQGGAMSLAGFRRSQEQFFNAVTFFPRPMATLVARIPEPGLRLDILRNLVEEHGDFHEPAFHHSTFKEFLRRIGADASGVETTIALHPSVRAFNATLAAACALDEIEVGVGAMGAIELAFAHVSACIGKTIVARNWITEEQLIHYGLHAEIDPRHASEFFAVVEPTFESRRYWIDQGIQLGLYALDRLYRDLPVDAEVRHEH
jgi:pyrroloquinoline-quinone synthase